MKKKPIVPPLEEMVISGIETTFNGHLQKCLTDSFAKGYTLVCPPVFVGNKAPFGACEEAYGCHPHFLIVLQKLPTTLNQ